MPLRHFTVVAILLSAAVHAQGPIKATTHLPADLNRAQIKLEGTGCYGTCPIYTVSISGGGTVAYHGGQFVKIRGKQNARISTEAVRQLVSLFNSSNYFELLSSYGDCGSDLPTAVISVEGRGFSKAVIDCGGESIPPILGALKVAIDVTANNGSVLSKRELIIKTLT